MRHTYVDVCQGCLEQATEALVLRVLVMQASWVEPDTTVIRPDGTLHTWHEPLDLGVVIGGNALLCSAN